ncbi:beta/alpha barrel domain-containing protein [Mariniplasma anaerobium]|uniref:DUF3137 domain-containing protein n=1 Tax=Mariniplasma anaerobium TaxID=2735436 RepID=A0A7U9TH56_9MOLU|nr:hypothetical protein [Mariniplasma anaerobium]BCR36398.1 hypothetical protein MPAN_012910 [Mariniplasma anaerobium]
MNADFYKIKELNDKIKKGKTKKMLYVVGVMISIGIVLLIINSDQFITISVLLFFFALIISMISFFIFMLSKQRITEEKIKNSIKVIYPVSVNAYNNNQLSDFQIKTDSLESSVFKLFPDYCNYENMVTFFDEKSKLVAYATRIFINRREGRITPVFNGTYIIVPISYPNNFYYEKLHGALEYLAKAVSKSPMLSDNSIPTYFNKKTDFMGGKLSSDSKQELSKEIVEVIKTLEKNHLNVSLRLGIKDNELHIAVQGKNTYPPYVKKYNDKEKELIQEFVWDILKDMSDIINVLNI